MIRRLRTAEIDDVALIWYRSGVDEYHYLPRFQALNELEAQRIFREVIVPKNQIWLEEKNSLVRGFLALDNSYIDRLYVDPDCQRAGAGTRLLDHAKSIFPDGLHLHTHQQNLRARNFYEKHGFVATEFGISPAPESVPDVEYRWSPGAGA